MKSIGMALTQRLGTAAAAFLVAKLGIPEDLALKLVLAGGVLAGLAVDASVTVLLARWR